ncbi:hypothetical protein DE146DRAFT_780786 [Phaeosphaeria sp. MPI-PUGE-AT-0046c]|nr:hypothetical protein DE146DRAFT_780786 [Phaeosphaeria sp. MPI-PUGE-AT-0046c]
MASFMRKLFTTRGRFNYSYLNKDVEGSDSDVLNQSLISKEEVSDDVMLKSNKTRPGFIAAKRIATVLWMFLSAGAFFTGLHWRFNTQNICNKLDSFWTPVWDDVDPQYHLVKFNGTLDAWSEFRGPPSAAVDAAWSRLDDFGSVALSEEEFLRAGGTLDNSRMPDEFGGKFRYCFFDNTGFS